ncbi:MAG: hypothetical protein ACYSUK_12105 [Planctomycetota bacterium]|jgi:hypothetical protein
MVFGQALIKGVRRISLGTRDAQGLYSRYGFKELNEEEFHGQMRLNFDMPWYRPDLVEE